VAPQLVEALVAVGARAEAAAVTARLRALSECQAHPWGLASAKRCDGVIRLSGGEHDDQAVTQMAEAAADFERLGLPFDQARTLLALGRAMLQLGDTAPDFEAETTTGPIRFHDWIGDSWAVLFSHPKDFTPVCTTELGYMARIKPEFDRRGVKIIGLSVDSTSDHARWAHDIEETQGAAPNYPVIGDADFTVAKLYGMLPASVSGDAGARTPADNQTVRNVFVIGPDKKIKLILVYPMTTGRNFDEVLRVLDSSS
jgi:alkyl hydroperoxide reductase subunit AhpC